MGISCGIPGGVENEGPSVFSAKAEPWMQSTLNGYGNGIRRPDSERIIVWVNYVSAGVVSARQNLFSIEQLTQMCHANPRTCAAIVILPNRAGDLRSSPTKQPGKFYEVMPLNLLIAKLEFLSHQSLLFVSQAGGRRC